MNELINECKYENKHILNRSNTVTVCIIFSWKILILVIRITNI